jgi:hypothetical protein
VVAVTIFGSEEPPPAPSPTPVQKITSVLIALAAIFSVIFQSSEKPVYAWTLVFLALLVIGSNFYKPLVVWVRAKNQQARRNKVARASWAEFMRFKQRFAAFVNPQDGSNLRQILFRFCGNNSDELSKLCPPDYLPQFFELFAEPLEREPAGDEPEFSLAVREMYQIVSSYNTDYVQEPFRRLRHGKRLSQSLEHNREYYEREIEDFRSRWVRFLEDFQQFLEKVNSELGYRALDVYFVHPQKL